LFVEINTGAEAQKSGILPQDADAFLAACRDQYGLKISGLMCIPPLDEAPGPHFALTAKIARRNRLDLLSMGMSADFATAIELGATHVRVGTAIFGDSPKIGYLNFYSTTIFVLGPRRVSKRRSMFSSRATQPAVGENPSRAA
jgi:hypothetical protein